MAFRLLLWRNPTFKRTYHVVHGPEKHVKDFNQAWVKNKTSHTIHRYQSGGHKEPGLTADQIQAMLGRNVDLQLGCKNSMGIL